MLLVDGLNPRRQVPVAAIGSAADPAAASGVKPDACVLGMTTEEYRCPVLERNRHNLGTSRARQLEFVPHRRRLQMYRPHRFGAASIDRSNDAPTVIAHAIDLFSCCG